MSAGKTVRHRIYVTAVLDYDVRLEDYGTDDPDEALRIDQISAEDDLYMFLDNKDTKWDVIVSRIT